MNKTPAHGPHHSQPKSLTAEKENQHSLSKKPQEGFIRKVLSKLGLTQRTRRANAILAILGTMVFCSAYLGVTHLIALGFTPTTTPVLPTEAVLEEETTIAKAQEPFYVLLIGSDSRKSSALYTGKATEPSQVDQYSDVMTLLRVDPVTYRLTLLTIPQDTRLLGSSETLNASLTGGDPVQVVEAVEALTGLTIDNYMMTTFTAFEGLVDALGGVVVKVPVEIHGVDPLTADPIVIPEGERRLNGAQAIVFARAWEEFGENPDVLRQENVRALEIALLEAALDSSDPSALVAALGDLWRYTETNLDAAFVGQVGLDFFENRDKILIYAGTGPWEADPESEEVGISADPAIWSSLIATVDAGEDPSTLVELP